VTPPARTAAPPPTATDRVDTASIHGRVVFESDETPVPRVYVGITPWDGSVKPIGKGWIQVDVKNEDGVFEGPPLNPGSYLVAVAERTHDGGSTWRPPPTRYPYGPSTMLDAVRVDLPPGETRRLEFKLQENRCLFGRVAAEDGAQVTAVDLDIVGRMDSPPTGNILLPSGLAVPITFAKCRGIVSLSHRQVRLSDDGRFQIPIPFDGSGQLTLRAVGGGWDVRQVTVPAIGDVHGVDFTFRRGAAVTGLLVDPRGYPVAGAPVRLNGSIGDAPPLMPRTLRESKTDDAGRYRLEGIPPGPYTLMIDQSPYRNASIRATVSDGITVLDTDKITLQERGNDGGQSWGPPAGGAAQPPSRR
jgi:hypothetical protein